jgi:thiol-disulfide isomerase/thioredoxin
MKSMKTIMAGLACLAALSAAGQNREIVFKDADWKTQLANAKKENKLIFFDAYTTWCGPCKMMAKDVFTKDSVADLFNQTFINVKYDMEKGEGITLKDKFEVSAFPTYLFINGDGEVVHKIVGSAPAAEFMAEAGKALKPESTVFGLAKKFDRGDHSEATSMAYLEGLDKAYESDKMGRVAKVYFDGLPKAALMEAGNWDLIQKYLNTPSSAAFAYLYANKEGLGTKYGAAKVEGYFQQTFNRSVYSVKRAYEKKVELKDAQERVAAIRKLLASGTEYSKPILTQLDLTEYATSNQWDKFSARLDKIWNDDSFPRKNSFVVTAANDILNLAPAKYYPLALNWAVQIGGTNPDLFTKIQVADLKKRAFKKQGKSADAEAMALEAESLRKEASAKGQMTPPMMKD